VEANVDEADIGQVKQGQPVDFTVDAFPTEIFKGDVRQIRLQPIVTSNVVTYTVIVNAPNPDKKLMPGMTANITVLVQKVDSVLIVPGKALRFTPDAAFLAEYMKNNPMGQRQGTGGAGRPAGAGATAGTGGATAGTGGAPGTAAGQPNSGGYQAGGQTGKKPVIVWVKEGDKVRRVRVATGAIDGSNAEIKFGLKEGDEVILSMTLGGKSSTTTAAAPTTTSPFMPTRPPQGVRR
jgi:HlyD family secretion protein